VVTKINFVLDFVPFASTRFEVCCNRPGNLSRDSTFSIYVNLIDFNQINPAKRMIDT